MFTFKIKLKLTLCSALKMSENFKIHNSLWLDCNKSYFKLCLLNIPTKCYTSVTSRSSFLWGACQVVLRVSKNIPEDSWFI